MNENLLSTEINFRIDQLIGAVRQCERNKYVVADLKSQNLDTGWHEKQVEYWQKQISKQRYHINKQLSRVKEII